MTTRDSQHTRAMRREGPRASNSAPTGGSEAAKPLAWGDHKSPQGRPQGRNAPERVSAKASRMRRQHASTGIRS